MPNPAQLLVVAGEASGDEFAADVLTYLGVRAFGLGGPQLQGCQTELLGHVAQVTTMGLCGAFRLAPRWLLLARSLLSHTRARRPRAALLVGFSEFNGWLGRRLRRLGIPVLWFAPPQVWAWRPRRARRLAASCDRMAVLLPFEQAVWQSVGVHAHFVGHPAALERFTPRPRARLLLGVKPRDRLIALLPGSRPSEVMLHLEPMLAAAQQLRREHGIQARLVLSPGLPLPLNAHIRACATQAEIGFLEPDQGGLLGGFDDKRPLGNGHLVAVNR